jgi:membrane protein implicated in regulation of membrane protease activity
MLLRKSSIPVILFALIVVLAGIVHGRYTNRWEQSNSLNEAIANLEQVPVVIGDWSGKDVVHEPEDLQRAGIRGSVWRTYKHQQTGSEVSILLVCGRGGPLSVHTPDVCYAGAGFKQAAPQALLKTTTDSASFWWAPFDKPHPLVPQRLNVVWGWSQDGAVWVAPESPRSVCAWQPAMYKLYVVHSVSPKAKDTDPVPLEFLNELLQSLKVNLAKNK